MGFGSYDESEQEQQSDREEDNGESVTKQGIGIDGEDRITDQSTSEIMAHL